MSSLGTISGRQWAQLMLLGLMLAVAIVVVLAVVLPTAALALGLALAVTVGTLVVQRAAAVGRTVKRTIVGEPEPEAPAQPTLRIEVAEGVVLVARPVPLRQDSEHSVLLTRDGYLVVNDEGRVIHRIGS